MVPSRPVARPFVSVILAFTSWWNAASLEEYEPGADLRQHRASAHVLEHVEDPITVLARVKTWLSAKGRLFASVPNARSLHRQMAVVMGLLPSEHSLNPADLHHGHRRVYDPESLRRDVHAAGFPIELFGGYWLKPVANHQLEANWTPEMLEAAMVVGERYPDVAAEIYVIAGHKDLAQSR